MGSFIKSRKHTDFKTCSVCRRSWKTRDEFLEDPAIDLIGYQVHFKDLHKGLFLFNHSCHTSLAIPVKTFVDLFSGPFLKINKMGTGECPNYCLRENDLSPCPAECECAYVREIMQVIRGWSKIKSENAGIIHPGSDG
jgi:hypothetical protein